MNYRDYKQFAAGTFWHVFNRGNGKQDIFLDNEDFLFFLSRLKEYLNPQKIPIKGEENLIKEAHTPYIRKELPPQCFTLLSYSLMPNHFHFEIKQNQDIAVSKLISKLCTSYSKYFNKKYGKIGGLFQDAFKAVPVNGDAQLLWLSAYIHNNPKTGGLVDDLKDYPWSSYPDYIGVRKGTLCGQSLILGIMNNDRAAYQKFAEGAFEAIKERKDLKHLFLN